MVYSRVLYVCLIVYWFSIVLLIDNIDSIDIYIYVLYR